MGQEIAFKRARKAIKWGKRKIVSRKNEFRRKHFAEGKKFSFVSAFVARKLFYARIFFLICSNVRKENVNLPKINFLRTTKKKDYFEEVVR